MSYKNEKVEPGSTWLSSDHKKFQVINTTEIDGNTWVYYRKYNSSPDECREYSCYLESFLTRFSRTVSE